MINYITEWTEQDRKRQWSGTTFSLYEALKKRGEVRSIELTPNKWVKLFHTVANTRYYERKIHIHNDFQTNTINYKQKLLNRALKGVNDINGERQDNNLIMGFAITHAIILICLYQQ